MKEIVCFTKLKPLDYFFFFSFVRKMEFIDTEAIADNDQQLLCDSEEEEEKITEELDDFIDNNSQLGESVNFYRDVDNNPSEFHS